MTYSAADEDGFVKKVRAQCIGSRYRLIEPIARGGGGSVYLGRDEQSHEQVALKLEREDVWPSTLKEEASMLERLAGLEGIPRCYWFGNHGEFRVLAFELLGPSLEDLLEFCERRFSELTTAMLAISLIDRLCSIHGRSVHHADIKPGNFLMGTGKNTNRIYIADFGLSAEAASPSPIASAAPPRRFRLMGTALFASVNAHWDAARSAKADLESLGYVLAYFLRGDLPWSYLVSNRDEEKMRKIANMKEHIPSAELFAGFPKEYQTYMDYCRALTENTCPDYQFLRGLFWNMCQGKNRWALDNCIWDWTLKLFAQAQSS